jgi:PAS domain S-box-containing protein
LYSNSYHVNALPSDNFPAHFFFATTLPMSSLPIDPRFDRHRLVAALKASRCGTWRWDIANNVVDWDEALSDVFGIEHKNAPKTAEEFFALVHPEDRQRMTKAIEDCSKSGTELEYDFRAVVNGKTRWIYDRSQLTRSADGTPWYFIGACLDVTERRRTEEALTEALTQQKRLLGDLEKTRGGALAKQDQEETAHSSKSRFLATMSHELRTPLNAILGFSEIIAEERLGPVGNPRYKDYAGDILASGKHLLSLINDLLDVAKIEANRMAIDPRILETERPLQSALQIAAPNAEERHQTITATIADDAKSLYADERALKQIFINLLSNAVKFTQDGGSIEVSVRRNASGEVEISVSDNGPGIPKDKLGEIFKPFSRLDDRYDSQGKGTGLGLALVRGLTELHGGRVGIDSAPGKGTRVTVTLPGNGVPKS